MIRNYLISKDKTNEVVDWLTANISTEDVRWWRVPASGTWDNQEARYHYGHNFFIDVTEEEEPMLTAFVLKYS